MSIVEIALSASTVVITLVLVGWATRSMNRRGHDVYERMCIESDGAHEAVARQLGLAFEPGKALPDYGTGIDRLFSRAHGQYRGLSVAVEIQPQSRGSRTTEFRLNLLVGPPGASPSVLSMDKGADPYCRYAFGGWTPALSRTALGPGAQGALSALSQQASILELAGKSLRFAPDLERSAGAYSLHYFVVVDPQRLIELMNKLCDTYAQLAG